MYSLPNSPAAPLGTQCVQLGCRVALELSSHRKSPASSASTTVGGKARNAQMQAEIGTINEEIETDRVPIGLGVWCLWTTEGFWGMLWVTLVHALSNCGPLWLSPLPAFQHMVQSWDSILAFTTRNQEERTRGENCLVFREQVWSFSPSSSSSERFNLLTFIRHFDILRASDLQVRWIHPGIELVKWTSRWCGVNTSICLGDWHSRRCELTSNCGAGPPVETV